MTNTTYYNLNIVEGTDIVNPLIVDNPNYEKIDEVMHDNAVSGVTLATEIANATVHAITRENSECAVIRFIATSNWKAGDTVTVDGVPVTALLPSGETLPDGAYVINANVLCILTGTNLTVYAERKKINNATEIVYNDTTVAAELNSISDKLTTITRKVVTTELFGSHIQYGSATCVKIGRIVWLHINVSFSSAINTYGEVLGKLPVEFTPLESFTYGLTPTNTQSTASNYFEITDNGNSICYNSPDTLGAYNFCGAYISKI